MITTKRLLLKPLTYDQVLKYIKLDNSLESELKVNKSNRLVSLELKDAIENTILPNLKVQTGNDVYKTLWTVILKDSNQMIGDFCLVGESDFDDEIEINDFPQQVRRKITSKDTFVDFVELTGTIYDADDVALAAGFVAIDDDNAPAPENVVHPNEVINNLFEDEWGHSGICYRRLTGASNCNP